MIWEARLAWNRSSQQVAVNCNLRTDHQFYNQLWKNCGIPSTKGLRTTLLELVSSEVQYIKLSQFSLKNFWKNKKSTQNKVFSWQIAIVTLVIHPISFFYVWSLDVKQLSWGMKCYHHYLARKKQREAHTSQQDF